MSVIVFFVCLLLQIGEVYNEAKQTVYSLCMPVIVFSRGDCPLVLKLVDYTFNHKTYLCTDVCCKRSKQTVNAGRDWYKIPSCRNNLFRDKQIVCLRQIDYMRRNSLLIKVQV